MDNVRLDLASIVQNVVEDYADGEWFKADAYAVCDNVRQIYVAVVVPRQDYPLKLKAGVVVMARVVGDVVIVEHDTTDQPFYQELMRQGIPREKIVLTYAGEQAPVP
jgi:hypothetical protein